MQNSMERGKGKMESDYKFVDRCGMTKVIHMGFIGTLPIVSVSGHGSRFFQAKLRAVSFTRRIKTNKISRPSRLAPHLLTRVEGMAGLILSPEWEACTTRTNRCGKRMVMSYLSPEPLLY
jgi:hypothetical protein